MFTKVVDMETAKGTEVKWRFKALEVTRKDQSRQHAELKHSQYDVKHEHTSLEYGV
jgi:hypothetical protein